MTTLSAQQIAGAAQQAGFSGQDLIIAVAVALAESSGDDHAVNHNSDGSTDYGAWQINTVHGNLLNQGDKFNAVDNAKMAYSIWRNSGWGEWTTYNTGAYLPYMGVASMGAGNPISPGAGSSSNMVQDASLGSDASGVVGLLTNKAFWLNFAVFIGGSILLYIAIIMIIKNSKFKKATDDVIDTAVVAFVPEGRAVAAARRAKGVVGKAELAGKFSNPRTRYFKHNRKPRAQKASPKPRSMKEPNEMPAQGAPVPKPSTGVAP